MRAKYLVATLAVLLLIGIANVGQAADGDPLILGQENIGGHYDPYSGIGVQRRHGVPCYCRRWGCGSLR
jgi:hypothetical protein